MITGINSGNSNLSLIRQNQEEKKEKEEQLASSKRINSASDDPAGLQISSRLTSQINELAKLNEGYQDNINYNQTVDGQLQSVNESLYRAQELSTQTGSGLLTPDDLGAVQGELDAITEQVNTVVEAATGQANFLAPLDASDPAATQAALEQALASTNDVATTLGAESNALQAQVNVNQNSYQNLSASRSRILDTDYAQAASEQSQLQALLEASVNSKKDNEERKGLLFNQLV